MDEEIVAAMKQFDVVILQTAESVFVVCCTCGVHLSIPIPSDGIFVRTMDDGVWRITSQRPIQCNILKGAEVNDVHIFVRRDFGLIAMEVVIPFSQKALFIDAREEDRHPSSADGLIDCLSSQGNEYSGGSKCDWPPQFSLN